MLLEHELILNDFFSADNFSLDGLIIASLTDLNRLKSILTKNELEVVSFLSLNSFMEAEIKHSSYCFITMDDAISIDEATSLLLFRKVRGKIKVIIYYEMNCNLKDQEFFIFINWARLITI